MTDTLVVHLCGSSAGLISDSLGNGLVLKHREQSSWFHSRLSPPEQRTTPSSMQQITGSFYPQWDAAHHFFLSVSLQLAPSSNFSPPSRAFLNVFIIITCSQVSLGIVVDFPVIAKILMILQTTTPRVLQPKGNQAKESTLAAAILWKKRVLQNQYNYLLLHNLQI